MFLGVSNPLGGAPRPNLQPQVHIQITLPKFDNKTCTIFYFLIPEETE